MVKCPIKSKEVDCDGVCRCVRDSKVFMCPVFEKSLDTALNG